MKTKECKNRKHLETERGYLYTCKKCEASEKQKKHEIPCPCKCNHDTFTCTICWKPVGFDKTEIVYRYVKRSEQ